VWTESTCFRIWAAGEHFVNVVMNNDCCLVGWGAVQSVSSFHLSLKMEAAGSSKMWVMNSQSTQSSISEDGKLRRVITVRTSDLTHIRTFIYHISNILTS